MDVIPGCVFIWTLINVLGFAVHDNFGVYIHCVRLGI